MSLRSSSIELNENKSASSLTKLILLSSRTIRYTIRTRCCYCIPVILCELIFPLLIIGIIICVSHYLLSDSNTTNNNLFNFDENETCSQYSSEYNLNKNEIFYFENNCLNIFNDIFINKYSKINIIIRYLNNNSNIINKLIENLKNHLIQDKCFLYEKLNIIIWNNISENDNSILFNKPNFFNLIIHINELYLKKFDYDIIIEIPQIKNFKDKLIIKIDNSFLQRHQHPSEQINIFKRKSPPFINIKMFIDLIGINTILNADDRKISLINSYTISCTSYRYHKTIPTRWSYILMELTLSITYLFFYFIIVNSIIEENNKKVKEILKIIHIQPIINYFAWALRSFFILSFITFSITGLWKISIGGWIVFEYVSSSILIIVFLLLNIQLISYSILMGQLFTSFTRLFLLTIIIWIIMNILAYKDFNQIYQIIFILNPYFSLIYILRHLYLHERSMNNVNLYKRLYKWSPLFLTILFIMLLSIPFYWIFIWYIEKIYPGQYGIGLSWNFPFSKEYWISNENKSILSNESLKSISDNYQNTNENSNSIIVKIDSLIKYFPKTNRTVVNNVSFNLYENQITALLGHNGADEAGFCLGKTTIMNMLCGIYEQTDGSIKIYNYDTREYIDYLRQFISYCPQHDILFDLLTVEEQIEFHAIARGYSNDKEYICTNLLEEVNLINYRNVLCKNLSGGMKRRLSIACAFIGNTKLVLLDEPSSGLDPINRRLLWTWIRSMKENRTILLSTHFLEEADALSDRIIILSNGKICANDTSIELKKFYGTGYKLIINTINEDNNINICNIVKKYFSNSILEIETNNQLIIQTNENSSKLFIQLLNQLDTLKEKKIILNYGLSNTTLEEVFLRITTDENENKDEYEENKYLIEENCFEIFNKKLIEEGWNFYLSQYEGLFIKSIKIAYRTWKSILFISLIPFFIQYFINNNDKNYEIIFDINDWSHLKEQNVFIAFNPYEYDKNFFNQIINLTNQRSPLTHIHILNNITNIEEFNQLFLMHRKSDVYTYSNEYFGLLFESNDKISILTSHLIIGYEAFSFICEYLCQGECDIKTRLKFLENPQNKLNNKNFLSFIKNFSLFSCFYGILPGELTEIYLITYYLIYFYISILIISEENELIKLMRIFGLHPIIYWTSRYFFDFILSGFYSFFLYFIYSLNDQKEFYQNKLTFNEIIYNNNLEIKNKFYPFTLIISLTILPFIYLITKLMKNDLIGGLLIFLILILIEFIDLIRIVILIMMKGSSDGKIFYWLINIIFPSLNVKRLISILLKDSSKSLCKLIENDNDILSKIGFINEIKEKDFLIHCLLCLIQIIIIFFILYLIDTGLLNDKINKYKNSSFNYQFNEDELDDDVYQERISLISNKDLLDYPLVCVNIVKKYPNKDNLALNHLTFRVKQGECFGLLGFNGAGKTSLFKIIVGEEKPTNGFISINGKYFHGFSRDIGYCPQYDCIQDKLTLEDYLYLFGRLRGIINQHLKEIIENLSQVFLLDVFIKQYVKQLSGGTIRRMHAAIACIGPPDIILLDEPTTGVDPYSRRQMRKIFEYALNNNITMILTSHSMDECEMLCSRLGIMFEGQFQCLGNIQDLKTKFGNNYSINIKINSNDNYKYLIDLYNYLKNEIKIKIYHQTESTIIFQIDQLISSPAKLFYLIESIKEKFFIETYSIQQITLEQIFISLQNLNN